MAELELPVSFDEARPLLLPVLRRVTEPPRAWVAGRADPDSRVVRRAVLPFLHELITIDLPEVRLFVNEGHLKRWGVTADAARAAAHATLRPHASDGLQQRAEYGLWQLASGDGLETSRLVLPGWLAAFEGQVEGRPVAIAPASRVLLVGGDGREPEVERLLALADQVFRTAQQPVSPVPFTVDDDGTLRALSLPDDHPSAAALQGARRLLAAYEYAAQRDQLIDEPGLPARPLQVQLVRHATSGRAWTVCRWSSDDAQVLLPQTDRVVLVRGEAEVTVPFEALLDHAGGCLEPTDLDPARYRARWPLPATLDAVCAHAVEDA
jgi:hypothetical protein